MSKYEAIREWMVKQGNGKRFDNFHQMASFLKLHKNDTAKFYETLKGKRTPKADAFIAWLEGLGVEIIPPDQQQTIETAKSVHFVEPQIISSDQTDSRPADDDYVAVPLASRAVAAGNGIIPDDSHLNWVLVWKGQEAVRHRNNLAVVKIDKREGSSMEPTLHPEDLALIDRDDRVPREPPGNIYLVQLPSGDEMGLAIKRARTQRKDGKELIVFYSDNPEFGPEIYDLASDYDNNIRNAIKGRVVWSWSDMTKK
jgi:phage repressor protein C with HTH and peptisase S24 domain